MHNKLLNKINMLHASPRGLRAGGAAVCAVFLWLGHPGSAAAQQPGQPGQINPFPNQPTDEDKPEGTAEQAPPDGGLLPSIPVLPPPTPKQKRFELLQIDGYFRFRTDWMKNLHLGFNDALAGGAPFPRAAGCQVANGPCDDTLKSANIRFRLEPVVHIDERKSVHAQIDIFDNLVLGSTPLGVPATDDGLAGSLGAFSYSQTAPRAGFNAPSDSIVVKRAWAEVLTSFDVLLKFGRQPGHWGMGLHENSGSFDPIHGTWDLDADQGTTVDRLMVHGPIPGTSLRFAAGTDWSLTTPTYDQSDVWNTRFGGQGWDAEDSDDISQWVLVISHLNTPREFKDRVDNGRWAMNYGIYFAYRTQGWDYTPAQTAGDPIDPAAFYKRDLTAYIFDPWIRVAKGKMELEAEALAIVGDINEVGGLERTEPLSLRQFGGVVRYTHRFMGDKLRLGMEAGFASGDQWDNAVEGNTHYSQAVLPRDGDGSMDTLFFNPEYKIDLILFRELLGTVYNAAYLRPNLGYQISKSFDVRVQGVLSAAHKPIATPGNSEFYGLELDADVSYSSDGFQAGIAYGILFPFAALAHPDDTGGGGPGFSYDPSNVGDAGRAHTIQTRLSLAF